eukprot:TRINITY_DN10860_c0_g3_i1.p1 TRINITY_DN10860_c0_g3~~TRINITY_DN10860_c0_g3_i1.p1  ORF type:complete len:684 (-),score=74.11 TRINITY_DN10860_c0_g3_i1:102-2153(-)
MAAHGNTDLRVGNSDSSHTFPAIAPTSSGRSGGYRNGCAGSSGSGRHPPRETSGRSITRQYANRGRSDGNRRTHRGHRGGRNNQSRHRSCARNASGHHGHRGPSHASHHGNRGRSNATHHGSRGKSATSHHGSRGKSAASQHSNRTGGSGSRRMSRGRSFASSGRDRGRSAASRYRDHGRTGSRDLYLENAQRRVTASRDRSRSQRRGPEVPRVAGRSYDEADAVCAAAPPFSVMYWEGGADGWNLESLHQSPWICRRCDTVADTWRSRLDALHSAFRTCSPDEEGFSKHAADFLALTAATSIHFDVRQFCKWSVSQGKKALTESMVIGTILDARNSRWSSSESGLNVDESRGSWEAMLRTTADRLRREAHSLYGSFAAVFLDISGGELLVANMLQQQAAVCIDRILVVVGGPTGIPNYIAADMQRVLEEFVDFPVMTCKLPGGMLRSDYALASFFSLHDQGILLPYLSHLVQAWQKTKTAATLTLENSSQIPHEPTPPEVASGNTSLPTASSVQDPSQDGKASAPSLDKSIGLDAPNQTSHVVLASGDGFPTSSDELASADNSLSEAELSEEGEVDYAASPASSEVAEGATAEVLPAVNTSKIDLPAGEATAEHAAGKTSPQGGSRVPRDAKLCASFGGCPCGSADVKALGTSTCAPTPTASAVATSRKRFCASFDFGARGA